MFDFTPAVGKLPKVSCATHEYEGRFVLDIVILSAGSCDFGGRTKSELVPCVVSRSGRYGSGRGRRAGVLACARCCCGRDAASR